MSNNFSERLRKCFSSYSFWEALNKIYKSSNLELTNENGLVTIGVKNSPNVIKFSYVDNGDKSIVIDFGIVENFESVIESTVEDLYDAAMNSGFEYVKFFDHTNDPKFKEFSNTLIKTLRSSGRNLFSWS